MRHACWLALTVAACGTLEPEFPDFQAQQLSTPDRQLIRVQAPAPRQFEDWLDHGFDPWQEDSHMVVGEADSTLLDRMRRQGVRIEQLPNRPIRFTGFDKGYHTYQAMEQELQALQAKYPDKLRLVDFGDSWETTKGKAQRQLWATVMGRGQRKVLLFAALHARELVTVEMAMNLINELAEQDGKDPTITQLLDKSQVWVAPMLNPDGHIQAEKGLSWRKNTNTSYGGDGVDLNRNFSWEWGGAGASNRPGDPTYRGPKPFSEPETQALKQLMENERFDASLSWHSFSNLVLWPWGYTTTPSADDKRLAAIGQAMAKFSGYTPEQSADLYVAAGDSEDWAFGTFHIPAFTIEIGNYSDGFDPPFSKVAKFWRENRPMALYLIDKAAAAQPR